MAAKKTDKYGDYRYKITTPAERREVKWLIEQGDYKDMDDFIEKETLIQKRIMRRNDAANKNHSATPKKKMSVDSAGKKAA